MTRIVSSSNEAVVATRRFLALIAIVAVGLSSACGNSADEEAGAPRPDGAQTATGPAESPEARAYQSVVSRFESRDYVGAVRNARDFVARHPDSARVPQVLYISGRASVIRGDFDEGIATLTEMHERFPGDENIPFVDFYRAQAIYLKTHAPVSEYQLEQDAAIRGYEKALSAFREVATAHQGDAEVSARARLMAGQILFDMDRREEALAVFQAYLKKEPQGKYADQALFQVGDILMDLDRLDEATDAFNRLATEYPGNPKSGTAIDRIREMSLIGEPMPSLQNLRWINSAPAPVHRGEVVLVVFWSTWCGHCQHEMPKLEILHKKFKSRGLTVLGLTSNSQRQSDAEVNSFIKKYGVTFPIGIETGQAANAYAVGRIPAVAIIDRKGIVRWRNSGDLVTEALIERFL